MGKRLQHYRIEEKIGAGGMGVVYRATDTKLERDVAVKVLPENLTMAPERMGRFKREAQILASLNHPNIATVFGLEESEGAHCIVMELIPGRTLTERIQSEPFSVTEVLDIAHQIAEAVEMAHENGVVHRDLKPANVKITPDGRVKVLDFGLAKAFAEDQLEADTSHSPTLSARATRAGVILGTAAYMSPEQARGKPVDKRSDIFSFGCVLYEMLTGQQSFSGETVSDIIATIIKGEPDWQALPPDVGPKLRHLLQRCLEKDPRARWRDMGDVRIEIETIRKGDADTATSSADTSPLPRRKRLLAISAALVIAALAFFAGSTLKRDPPPRQPKHLAIAPVSNHRPANWGSGNLLAVSPQGQDLVFTAREGTTNRLLHRPLAGTDTRPIRGTRNATNPFFSPDGLQIGFMSGGRLMRVSLAGGNPQTVSDAFANYRGATWTTRGTIIYGTGEHGLFEMGVSDGAEKPRPLTTLDDTKGERAHRWPERLPDGRNILFTVFREGGLENTRIAVLSLDSLEYHYLFDEEGFAAQYVSTGHLVFMRWSTLMAAPFDLQQLEILEPPEPLIEGISTGNGGQTNYSVSSDGSLYYQPGDVQGGARTLVWYDRQGVPTELTHDVRSFVSPAVSPDGRRVAAAYTEGNDIHIWIFDIEREAWVRLTSDGAINNYPTWTPDGRRIAFMSNRTGPRNLFWRPSDGSGEAEILIETELYQYPNSWSPDGKHLAFTSQHGDTKYDINILSIDDRTVSSLVNSEHNEWAARFSPSDHWLAYISDESGEIEVYITSFPATGSKYQVSTKGGTSPRWDPEGKGVYYRDNNQVMFVSFEAGPPVKLGAPQQLFETTSSSGQWDIHPSGDRFLVVQRADDPTSSQIHVIVNWTEFLKETMPVR